MRSWYCKAYEGSPETIAKGMLKIEVANYCLSIGGFQQPEVFLAEHGEMRNRNGGVIGWLIVSCPFPSESRVKPRLQQSLYIKEEEEHGEHGKLPKAHTCTCELQLSRFTPDYDWLCTKMDKILSGSHTRSGFQLLRSYYSIV